MRYWKKNFWTDTDWSHWANVEQGENIRASTNREKQQGNETLNDGHDMTYIMNTAGSGTFAQRAL